MSVQKQPPGAFCKKNVRKTPVPETFYNKVAGLRPETLLKKDSGLRPATLLKKRRWYVKFLRTPFLQNTSERLFLNVGY